jgi:hypothetical protein
MFITGETKTGFFSMNSFYEMTEQMKGLNLLKPKTKVLSKKVISLWCFNLHRTELNLKEQCNEA